VPAESPQWDLTYAYSAGQRVVKSAKDALGVERHTLEIFSSLRFERDEFDAVAGDYERHRATTHVYLAGGAGHVFYDGGQLPAPPGTPPVRMYLNVGDHLGSATVTIDHTTSELVERATFHAFGATESDYRPTRWAAAREPYKFTGKEEDVEVGAVYFGARYYNAHLGRFISPDPLTVHGLGADPNPYAYVGGRVFSHVDPLGLDGVGFDPTLWIPGYGGASEIPVHAQGTSQSGNTHVSWTFDWTFRGDGSSVGGLSTPFSGSGTTTGAGLQTLDRGDGAGGGPSAAGARGLLAVPPEVSDLRGSDGTIDQDMQRGNDAAATIIAAIIAYRLGCGAMAALENAVAAALMRRAAARAAATAATAAGVNGASGAQGCSSGCSAGAAAEEHIAIGLERVVEQQAGAVGARHLMQDANWKQTFLRALASGSSRFTVFLDNMAGSGAYGKVITSVTRTATGVGGATDWEITQLYPSGRLGFVTFMEGGKVLPNPFQ